MATPATLPFHEAERYQVRGLNRVSLPATYVFERKLSDAAKVFVFAYAACEKDTDWTAICLKLGWDDEKSQRVITEVKTARCF